MSSFPFQIYLAARDLIPEIDMHCRIFLIAGSHLVPVIKFYVSLSLSQTEIPPFKVLNSRKLTSQQVMQMTKSVN